MAIRPEKPHSDPSLAISEFEFQEHMKLEEALEERKIEALKLYEPLPFQEKYHACTNKECVMVKGNQVGGSLAGFVEVARAVTGQDPYGKYPLKDGRAVCLGYGEKHIGRVIHRYLFRAGAFKIIRDLKTNKWRVFRPWPQDQELEGRYGDAGREEEAKLAPPLIPQRFIDGRIAWEKRSEHVFSYVKFKSGWELYALNSAGDPGQAQGFETDLYHIDEDVANDGWHEEAVGRCTMREGKIRWTALPHAKTDDIMNMIERADDEAEQAIPEEERTTIKISATIFDNPYMPAKSREENEKLWRAKGDDVWRKRALGEIDLSSIHVYPTFNKRIHTAIRVDDEGNEVQKILKESNGHPPDDWCRYMIVDPGHSILGVLFIAVPPPSLGDYRVIYEELYIRNADKKVFGQRVKERTRHNWFQDFIIDAHGGRLRELGSGVLPKRQYEEEMEQLGIECAERGSRFLNGSDDIKGREEKMREWLYIRADGMPKLMVVTFACPNFCREMERFKKKTTRIGGHDIPIDEANRRANCHLVECGEYGAAHGLPYVKPKQPAKSFSAVKWIKEQRKQRAQQRAARNFSPHRSSRSLGPRGNPTPY